MSMLPAVASLEGRLSCFGSIEAAEEVVGGFDHVDGGTRWVTYVDACIQNVNWTDVPVCPSSGVAASDGSLNRREVSGNGTSFTRPHRTPGTSIEWRV